MLTIWTLDSASLPLDASASGAMVGFALYQHAIGAATLTARYGR